MALHDSREDGWTVIYDKVYDVTEFLSLHPGGEDVILEYLGYDATLAFRGVGHSKAAVRMLKRLDSSLDILCIAWTFNFPQVSDWNPSTEGETEFFNLDIYITTNPAQQIRKFIQTTKELFKLLFIPNWIFVIDNERWFMFLYVFTELYFNI